MKPTIKEKDVPIHNQILAKCFNTPTTMNDLAWMFKKSHFYARFYVVQLIKAKCIIKQLSTQVGSSAKYEYIGIEKEVPHELILSKVEVEELNKNAPHDTGIYKWLGNPFVEGLRI